MAFTLSDLEAVETAIKSGVVTVKYQDRIVTYRSLKELQEIYELISASLADTTDLPEGLQQSAGTKRILTYFDKGV